MVATAGEVAIAARAGSGRRSRRAPVPLAAFFLLAFAVSWIGAVPMVLDSWRPGALPAGVAQLQLLMFFGAGLVALGVAWWNDGGRGAGALLRSLLAWRAGVRWYAFVFLAPALLVWSALHLSAWLGLGDTRLPRLGSPVDVLATFATIFLGYLLLNTEELAWRGYALPRLLERFGAPRASLLLGVLVALFHVPLFLMKGGHPGGYPFPLYAVTILAMTVYFTWLAQHTGGSLLLAHLFHHSFNSWAEAIPFFPTVTGSLAPVLVMAGALSVGAVLIVRRWSVDSAAGKQLPPRDTTAPTI